jgi:hypothetical protein
MTLESANRCTPDGMLASIPPGIPPDLREAVIEKMQLKLLSEMPDQDQPFRGGLFYGIAATLPKAVASGP